MPSASCSTSRLVYRPMLLLRWASRWLDKYRRTRPTTALAFPSPHSPYTHPKPAGVSPNPLFPPPLPDHPTTGRPIRRNGTCCKDPLNFLSFDATPRIRAPMPRIFIFLNDSWSSVAGGIQTVNHELCLALARIAGEAGSDHRVICICVDPTLEEIRVAREREVELVSADMVSTDDDPRVLTMLFRRELSQLTEVVGVFGHSKFTGLAAAAVKDAFFPTAKLVVIYHMDPDEVETAKGKWANAEERTRLELEAVRAADFALAVGPRLETVLKSSLSGMIGKKPIVLPLLCGMRDDVLPREACPERPTFLFVGRTDQFDVKGLDLFADAAGRLVKYWYEELRDQSLSEPKFVIRGLPDNKTNGALIYEQLKQRAEHLAGRHVQLVGHTYTTDECCLRTDIANASALVMPSRAEGFGLVALEALSYGVRPIVAHDSGIGEFLRARADPGVKELWYVVDTRAIGPNATDQLLNSLKYFTNRPAHSKILGENLRLKLLHACSWTAAARSILDLFPSEASQVVASALRIQASLRELLERERIYVENECRRISGRGPQDLLANRSVEPISRESRTSAVVVNQRLDELVKSHLPAIVLGEPGAGKTTALLSEVGQRCTVDLAALQSEPIDLDALEPSFYFHANDLAHVARPNCGFLREACLEVLSARHGALSDETIRWLRAAFIRERVLIAIDALDEVPGGINDENTYVNALVQLIDGSIRLQPQVKLLLTSRSSTYVEGSLQGIPEWHLKSFTPQEMLTAAQGWLKDERAAEQLMVSVAAAPPLGELIANPMLLMLACTVLASALKDGETLPSVFRRTDLYNGFVDWLTHRWLERQTSKGDQPILASRHELAILIEEVAWSLWKLDARRSTFTNAELAEAVGRGTSVTTSRRAM